MALTYDRTAQPSPWPRHGFAYPKRSGLRAALLVSTPISLLLWAMIFLLAGAI